MASYYLAQCLVKLTDEVDARMAPPNWPTVSVGDGWVGDTSHAARKSDHNPDWSHGGVVRAVDIGISGRDAKAILNEVIGDVRVWYVIHKGIIYSRTYGWAARRYTGSNPHNHHIHVSIRQGYEKNVSAWFPVKGKPKKKRTTATVNLANMKQEFQIATGHRKGKNKKRYGVKVLQRALNQQYGAGLKVDGWVGKKTVDAWVKHENATKGTGRKGVPDKTSLKTLQKRFKIKEK